MSKYAPLESHLRNSGSDHVPMTFKGIEHIIGSPLPPSAFKHRALWSNNDSNWVMTRFWLAAGYKTEAVDMANGTVVFRRTTSGNPPPPGSSGAPRPPRGPSPSASAQLGAFSRIFGALKGTVTVAPGTDLTAPIGEEWDAER